MQHAMHAVLIDKVSCVMSSRAFSSVPPGQGVPLVFQKGYTPAGLLGLWAGYWFRTQPPPQRSPCWSWTCAPVHVQSPGGRDWGQVNLRRFPLLNSCQLAKYFILPCALCTAHVRV